MLRSEDKKLDNFQKATASAHEVSSAISIQQQISAQSTPNIETKERETKHQSASSDDLTLEVNVDLFRSKETKQMFFLPVETGCCKTVIEGATSFTRDSYFIICPSCHARTWEHQLVPVNNIIFWKAFNQILDTKPELYLEQYYNIQHLYDTMRSIMTYNVTDNDELEYIICEKNQKLLYRYGKLFVNASHKLFEEGLIVDGQRVTAIQLFAKYPNAAAEIIKRYPIIEQLIKQTNHKSIPLLINPLERFRSQLHNQLKVTEYKKNHIEKFVLDFDPKDFICTFTQYVFLNPVELACGHLAEKSMVDQLKENTDDGAQCCPQCKEQYESVKQPTFVFHHIFSKLLEKSVSLHSERYCEEDDLFKASLDNIAIESTITGLRESKNDISRIIETKERETKHQTEASEKFTLEIDLDLFRSKETNKIYFHPVLASCCNKIIEGAEPMRQAETEWFAIVCPACAQNVLPRDHTHVHNIIFWKSFNQILEKTPQLYSEQYYNIKHLYQTMHYLKEYNDDAVRKLYKKLLHRYGKLFANASHLLFEEGILDNGERVTAVQLCQRYPEAAKEITKPFPMIKQLIEKENIKSISLFINPLETSSSLLKNQVKMHDHKPIIPTKVVVDFDTKDFMCTFTQYVFFEPVELICGHLAEKSSIEKLDEVRENQENFYDYVSRKCCPQCKTPYEIAKEPLYVFKHIFSELLEKHPSLHDERYCNEEDFFAALNEDKPSGQSKNRLNLYANLFSCAPSLRETKEPGSASVSERILTHRNRVQFFESFPKLREVIAQHYLKLPKFSLFKNPLSSFDEQIELFSMAVKEQRNLLVPD